MSDKQNTFNEAGMDGLILGAVSIVYVMLNFLLNKVAPGSTVANLVSVLLWAAKFYFCIKLLRVFMTRHAQMTGETVTSFRFGCLVSLLSALVYAAFYFVYAKYISPDQFHEAFASAIDAYSSMLDSQTLEMMENMESSMPTISFFTNLIWCSLFGVIISAIHSKYLSSSNPFDDEEDKPDDQ